MVWGSGTRLCISCTFCTTYPLLCMMYRRWRGVFLGLNLWPCLSDSLLGSEGRSSVYTKAEGRIFVQKYTFFHSYHKKSCFIQTNQTRLGLVALDLKQPLCLRVCSDCIATQVGQCNVVCHHQVSLVMHIEPSTVNVTGLRISFQQLKINFWLHERSYHEELKQMQVSLP